MKIKINPQITSEELYMFYESIGFVRNDGHIEYVIDTRLHGEKIEE